GEEQGGQERALAARAQLLDARILGLPFDATVPRVVVVGAVLVVLAVGLVVLVVVGDQVAQGEAIVGGDEVDAAGWSATAQPIQVAAAAQAIGQLGDLAGVAFPELAHVV